MTIVATKGLEQAILGHEEGSCDEIYPVIDNIPRLLVGNSRSSLYQSHSAWFRHWQARSFEHWRPRPAEHDAGHQLVARFDSEWQHFDDVGTNEHSELFVQYFDVVPPEALTSGKVAVDAGCGAGRWAYELGRRGVKVIAIDLGLSVEVARRNTAEIGNVVCVQADIVTLPLRDGSVDLAYSLGVLHHVDQTSQALAHVANAVAPGGHCLVYLYYALETRSVTHRAIFKAVDVLRRRTVSLPRPLLIAISELVALICYLPLARLSLLLGTIGWSRAAAALPLSYYAKRSFRVMRNDSLDRFGTALEKRYTRAQIRELMTESGLVNITISDGVPFWHAVGQKQ
jgi:SAM-dependent methyltransferase